MVARTQGTVAWCWRAGVLFAALGESIAMAAAPRLLDPALAGSNVILRLQADPGSDCRIEASTNLSTWFTVGSGVAADGVFTFQHAGPGTQPWLYYRGVQAAGVAATFPTVTPVASTNWLVSQVVFPESEATLRLEIPGGPTFSLVVPSNSVVQPTLVQLVPLESVGGMPNAAGVLAGVRLEPEGLVPMAPVFLEVDFDEPIEGHRISSFAFDNAGTRLHLVPDVVVANLTTNRVRILVNQLRGHGCGRFTAAELEALAATVPPRRSSGARPGLQADMAGCYPDEQKEAERIQEQLEDAVRPRQQAAAAILGADRQRQLLGTSVEGEGVAALERVMSSFDEFYAQELESRIPAGVQKCAVGQTLMPWVLGIERQRQLLGGGGTGVGGSGSASARLLCEGVSRCQQQAIECCRNQGGDTRLIQAVLGAQRALELLGGSECSQGLSLEEMLRECAPDWYGTLRVRISGRYRQEESVGISRVRRTAVSDLVLEASVLTAKVRAHSANIFAPAYTNLTCVLGGTLTGSSRDEKIEDSRETVCGGKPVDRRRDVWERYGGGPVAKVEVEALLMDRGVGNLFFQPYLSISEQEIPYDVRWTYDVEHNEPSEFTDEDCVTTHRVGGNLDVAAGEHGFLVYAKEEEFTWTPDTIRYSYRGPEPMRFDFEHLYDGLREVELELHRVR